jgi:hypothetical protein
VGAVEALTSVTPLSMSKFNIHVNPYPEILPPPWYRPPPGVTKGPTRIEDSIIFGLLIDYEEGRAWFKKTYDYELRSDHSEDLGIVRQLIGYREGHCLWVLSRPTQAGTCIRRSRHHTN